MASLAAAKLGVRNAGRRVGPASPTSCPRTSRWKNEDGGQVIVLVAVAVAVLLGIGGLVLDIGMAMVLRGDEQRAADAAALAGATEIFLGGTVSDAELSAQAFAEENGYDSAEVVVRVPPKSGKHIGDPNYVEVSIRRTSRTSFIRLLGIDSLAVTARGVAGLNPLPGDYALIVLNRTACKAYDHTSSSNLTIKNGAAIVNSSCEPSAYQGGGSLVTGTHLDYYVEGAWQLSNNATAQPSPTAVGFQIEDPLADEPRPVPCGPPPGGPSGCIGKSPTSDGTASNPKLTHITSATVLQPGTYYGGLKISGTGGGTVKFKPGLYVFAGGGSSTGGFDYTGTASLSGTGVTFFNTDYAAAPKAADRPCGDFSLQGSGSLSFTAPTSGTYKDMLFWQSDSCTQAFKYAGSSWTIAGVIYLPNAQLNVSGGGKLGATQVIVDTFSYSGSNAITIDYTNYVPTILPVIALVE
ncbi:MAG TPA: pilus assembly protein TadG-related protein [Candidatus Methylomirabilis sp.]|nr:pilus assembly protein TadG-related protein [Candidatus Methylomirabilis sp.]